MQAQDYRYTGDTLVKDYGLAVIGLTIFGAPPLFVPMSSVMFALFAGLGILFAAFAARTVLRHASRTIMDDIGIRVAGPWPKAIAWADMRDVKLKYFSTWRDRKSGWMQLLVKGDGGTIRLDQTLNGFEDVAHAAIVTAWKQGLTLNIDTIRNAEALGIELDTNRANMKEEPWA